MKSITISPRERIVGVKAKFAKDHNFNLYDIQFVVHTNYKLDSRTKRIEETPLRVKVGCDSYF